MRKLGCWVVTLLFFVKGSFSQQHKCGRAPSHSPIFGGDDAPEELWPWQASLCKNGRYFCRGSLISKLWVMTAAHCISSADPKRLMVRLGKQSLAGTNPHKVYRQVLKIHIHPEYDSSIWNNDIALLRMKLPVEFTDYISPVCLASEDSIFPDGTDCWIKSWRNLKSGVPLPYPGVVQAAKVSIINNNRCVSMLGPSLTENMICAGYLPGGIGPCQGDSGGLLVAKQNGVWVQVGITSWGRGCALPGLPAAYTRVSHYQSWITGILYENLPGFVTCKSSWRN